MRMHFAATATALVVSALALGAALFGPSDIEWPVAPSRTSVVALFPADASGQVVAGTDEIEWP
ncbi:hypothetical protein ACFVX6_22300 [Streptomyces sp. NPDC058289]|uniref:hypothetical protein n=1 Tax=Streptomyces sp. NPDC058289 TaxID=3346425 RepID=UPI0036E6502B